jgi:F-type H+-transporting ATPase subunit b
VNFNLTLIGQMISFAVFVWFTMTYVWTPIVKALSDRKAKIAEGLAAAERGHQEKSLGEQRAQEVLNGAKAQATEILSQAQKRASEIVEESKADGRSEQQRLVVAAQAEIERETNRAREELREKVAILAVAAAEKILKKEIDARAHQTLVDDFARQI